MSHPGIEIEHASFMEGRQTYSDLSCTCRSSSISKETENRILDGVRVVEVKTGANGGQKLFVRMLYGLKIISHDGYSEKTLKINHLAELHGVESAQKMCSRANMRQ